ERGEIDPCDSTPEIGAGDHDHQHGRHKRQAGAIGPQAGNTPDGHADIGEDEDRQYSVVDHRANQMVENAGAAALVGSVSLTRHSVPQNGIWLISQVRTGKGASGSPLIPAPWRALPTGWGSHLAVYDSPRSARIPKRLYPARSLQPDRPAGHAVVARQGQQRH